MARLLETCDTIEQAEKLKAQYKSKAAEMGLDGWIIHIRPMRLAGAGMRYTYGVYAGRVDDPPPPPASVTPRSHEPVRHNMPTLTAETQAKVCIGLSKVYLGWEFWTTAKDEGRRVLWHAQKRGTHQFLTASTIGELEHAVKLRNDESKALWVEVTDCL